ncbi:type I-E CRISPR-associated protein Cse1/CasA [Phytohabitans kaempferiae]|uniref:Type I-E CRISPR-associated protein Cse1/CasA n=1 Tax=Phytohabitans kaempferiae TaxID=1620943 RepID=A0ABV6M317_9ACTN
MPSFDLTKEPWLPVICLDGRLEEVSLTSLFHRAHEIRHVIGQTPPMTAALHRLVLALACRVYQPLDSNSWTELWRNERLPTQQLDDYLLKHPGRFDVFDKQRPFFQCPAVATVAASSAAKLVPYRSTGNNTTLFDHTTSRDEIMLAPAEAARWLVTLQAYDPGGLKSPYTKEKSSQAAPANWFGMVLVEGSNLKETLLLNLMPYDPDGEQPRNTFPKDRPVWEADPPAPEPDKRHPLGWTDLLTWPSRRVWLAHRQVGDQTVVDRVVITPGTRLEAAPEDNEWMAAYRRPEVRKGQKSAAAAGWYPIRLRDLRGVWRHSRELFLAPELSEERRRQRPATLDHVARMVGRKVISDDAVYTLRVFGQQLDSKSTVVHQVLEEAVAAPVALLKAAHQVAGRIIGHSIELADQVGSALNQMEREYRAELHGSPAAPSLELAYWPSLAVPFDRFLWDLAKALEADQSPTKATREWADDVRRIAEDAAKRWAESSPRQGRNLEVAGACYGRFVGLLGHHVNAYHGFIARYVA